MGWMYYYRTVGQSDRDHFQEKLPDGHEIVACATVRSVFYAAVQDLFGVTRAMICLITRIPNPNSYDNFGYKDMCETMGPCQAEAPQKVIDALSPIALAYPWDGEGEEPGSRRYAASWRQDCINNFTKQRPKKGQCVEFANEISFSSGAKRSKFIYTGRGDIFTDTNSYLRYRITGWRSREYTIENAESEILA